MRWKNKKAYPNINDEREVTRYLWLPCEIAEEVRWLEWAKTLQSYQGKFGWINKKWLNEEKIFRSAGQL